MASPNQITEHSYPLAPARGTRGGLGLYLLLLGVQTIGASLVFVNGVPIYRQMIGDFSRHQPHPEILWWAVAAVALIQFAYWLRVRLQPALPRRGHIVIGHFASFLARLSFFFASSTF